MATKTPHWIFADNLERSAQLDVVAGDLAYQIDTGLVYSFDGSAWSVVGGGGGASIQKPDNTDECGAPIARYLLEAPNAETDDGPNGLNLSGLIARNVRVLGQNGTYFIGAAGTPGLRTGVPEVAYVGAISFRWLGTFEGKIQGGLVSTRQYGIEANLDGNLFLRRSTDTTTGETPAVALGVGVPAVLTETVVTIGALDSGGVGDQTFAVYQNGAPISSGTFPNAVLRATNPDRIQIGGAGLIGSVAFEWQGAMLYIEVFDNELDPADILASYNRRLASALG